MGSQRPPKNLKAARAGSNPRLKTNSESGPVGFSNPRQNLWNIDYGLPRAGNCLACNHDTSMVQQVIRGEKICIQMNK